MRWIRRVGGLLPLLILWLMFSALLWGFVFTRITDTDPAHKVTVFIDAPVPGDTALAVALEEELEGGIRMVRVHPFTYAMFDGDALRTADIYLVRASDFEAYREWFAPLPEELRGDGRLLEFDGMPWGVNIFDAESGSGISDAFVQFTSPGEPAEDYFLCFGGASLHVPGNENALDSAALPVARKLLSMAARE